jgi:hypothetical protein
MYELPFDGDSATVKVIMMTYHDFTHTNVPSNVWGAFHALALEFATTSKPYGLLFDEVKLRESAGLYDLCSADFSLDQLSVRRRTARFGWINKPE